MDFAVSHLIHKLSVVVAIILLVLAAVLMDQMADGKIHLGTPFKLARAYSKEMVTHSAGLCNKRKGEKVDRLF